MPAAVAFIVGAVASVAQLGAVTSALLTLGASLAVGSYERDRAKRKARDAYNASLQDRLLTVRSGIAPRQYVLGTVRTAGALQHIANLGFNKQALEAVIALANNECELIAWYLAEERINADAFPGKYGRLNYRPIFENKTLTGPDPVEVELSLNPRQLFDSAPFFIVHATWRQGGQTGVANAEAVASGGILTKKVLITGLPAGESQVTLSYQVADDLKLLGQFKSGTADQTVTDWPGGYGSPYWTVNHRLRGTAHVRTLMIWDENLYPNGAPAVSAVLRGRAVAGHPFFDPRTGTNPTTTSNPALLWLWWRTLPRSLGGMGIPIDWIDLQSVSIAANICDELVTVRTLDGNNYEQIPRYSCDTVLSTANSPRENCDIILSAMAGRDCFTAGKYRVFAGAFRPATITLTDDDIVGTRPFTVNTADADGTPPNIVTARFSDANQNWQETNPKPVSNPDYIAADGGEQPLDLSLPATTDPRRARYLMGIALEEGRPAFAISGGIGGIGEDLALYDTVQLNLTNRPAYAGRTFEVIELTDRWDGTFDVTLREIRPQTWALDPDTYTPVTPVEPEDNSYLWDPPEITGFQIGSMTPITLPDGTAVTRIDLLWDPVPPLGNTPGARIELRYRKTGGDWIGVAPVPGDSTRTTITAALEDGEVYQFQARFVNGVGAHSPWVDTYTQIEGDPLPEPLALRLRASSTIFRVPATGNALPVSITLEAVRTGALIEEAVWTTDPSVTLGGSGDTRTLSYENMGENDAVTVTVSVTQNEVTYLDTLTILKVYDGAAEQPDFTPPPTPTGFAIQTGFLLSIVLTWDPPTYTEGRGHDATIIYGALVPEGGPQPTFADAKPLGSSSTNAYVHTASTGQTWAFWIKHQSRDGVLSNSPAGGTNGLQGTTGVINGTNLAPLTIEAANLASGAVTASKIAAEAIDATKFANGIEPVRIVASTLPSTYQGSTIYRQSDGKLYHWNGTAYTAQTPASDILGQLTNDQISSLAAAKLTGQITNTQIADNSISTPKLQAGSVQSNQIAAGAVIAEKIASNQIGTNHLTANAVTADKLAANSVVAGKIAAGAVNTQQLAANAVTTDKLLVTGRGAALNDDPACSDINAWTRPSGGQFTIATITDGVAGTTCLRSPSGSGSAAVSRPFAFDPAKTYRIRCRARNVGGNGVFYLLVDLLDASGARISGDGSFWFYPVAAVTPPSSFTEYTGTFGAGTARPFHASARRMACGVLMNLNGTTGFHEVQDLRIEEAIPASLIVDGAIQARHLAAGSIAVGTAAIANGAITNAMIADAAIDNAKIVNLSVGKLTAGILGADIQVGAGRITFDNGIVMRVQGTGFGTNNQFVDWFGPRTAGGNINLCSEANATYYLRNDGSAYFGGTLSAGTLFNSQTSTDVNPTAEVVLGPYGTNGGPKVITVSYSASRVGSQATNPGSGTTPSVTLRLYRTIGSGSETLIREDTITGTFTNLGFEDSEWRYVWGMGGSYTFTDNDPSTQDRTYRLTIFSRTTHSGLNPAQQRMTVTSTEE